jgi:hypothetical protein
VLSGTNLFCVALSKVEERSSVCLDIPSGWLLCWSTFLAASSRCQFCGLFCSLVLVLPAGYSFCRPASQFYHARSALDSAFDRFMSSAERGGLT